MQMIQFNTEFLCKPSQGEYVHLMRSLSSDRAGSRNYLAQGFLHVLYGKPAEGDEQGDVALRVEVAHPAAVIRHP